MSPIDVISYTSLRENLAKVMDEVCDAGSYVVVTRQNARPLVMMSLAEFRKLGGDHPPSSQSSECGSADGGDRGA